MNSVQHLGEEFQNIFENALEGIFQTSPDGSYIKVNPALARIFGYDSPEDMMQTVVDTSAKLHIDESVRKKFADILISQGIVEGFDAQNYRKDGSIIWTRTNARAVRDNKGNTLYFEGFLTEITALKEIELSLRESEERYRTLVDRLPGVVFLDAPNDSETTIYVSPKIEDILGYSQLEWTEDVIWSDVIHPDDRERVLDENKRTDETGELFLQEYRIRKKDDEYIWIREESSLLKDEQGEPLFWQGFFLDISNWKQAESVIQQSEEQFKTIFQANPLGSCIATLEEGRFIAANDAYWKLSGFEPDKILGHTSVELGFVTEESRKKTVARLKKEKSIHNESRKIITKGGETRNTLESFNLISFDGQDCILSMFYDMTDQTKAQEALQENEEKYRQLFDAESDAIFLIDNETGKILEANTAAMALYGYNKEELLRKKNSDLSAEPEETHKVTKETPIKHESVVSIPLRYHKKKDGTIFPVEITGRFFKWRGRSVHIAAIRDITERRKTEDALQHRLQELTILNEISLASTRATSIDELIEKVTQIIGESLYLDNFGVLLLNENDGILHPHPSYRGADAPISVSLDQGITGHAAATGKPLRIANVRNHRKYVEVTSQVRSELCVPISHGDSILGVINAESLKINAFTEDDEQLLTTTASTLATAIEKLHLLEAEKKQRHDAEVLREATAALTTSLDLQTLLETILDKLSKIVSFDSASIAINQNGKLCIVAGRGFPKKYGVFGKQIKSDGKWTTIDKKRGSIIISDVQSDPEFEQWEGSDYIRGWMGVAMVAQDNIIGYIFIDSRVESAYNEEDATKVETFANSAAVAIENAHLFEAEQRSREIEEALREATAALTTSIESESLYKIILASFSKLIPYDSASIELVNHGYLEIVAESNLPIDYQFIGKKYKYEPEKWVNPENERWPLIIPDVQVDERFEKMEGTEYIRCWMGVPLFAHDRLIGFLNLDSREVDFFTQEHAALAQTFGNQAAIAIENAHLFEAEQQRRQEAETLQKAAAIVSTTLNQNKAIELILEQLIQVVSFDSASIQLLHDGHMEIVGGRGSLVLEQEKDRRFPFPGDNPNTIVIQQRQPLILKNAPEAYPAFLEMPSIQSWLGVPLIIHERPIGILTLDSNKNDHFSEEQAQLVSAFANQAAIAIENARLFEAEQRRHHESEKLREATLAITTSLELESVLDTLLIVMKQVLPYDSASVLLHEGDELRLAATQGFSTPESLVDLTFPVRDELFEEIKKKKQPLILEDAQKDSRYKKWGKSQETRGWMGIPLIERDEVIGCITIDNSQPNAYETSSVTLALSFAYQASTAIRNARQYEAEQRHYEEAETLRQTAESIAASLDIQEVLNAILDNLSQVVPFDSAALLLIEEEKVRLTAGKGFIDNDNVINLTFPASNALLQEVWETGKPLILENAQSDPRFEKWATTDLVGGWMGVPLISRGGIIGYITIDSSKVGAYGDHDANLAITFAHQAAAAIENARLYERSEQQIRQLTVLRDIDSAISSSFDLRVVLNLLLEQAVKVLEADAAVILLYDPDLQSLSPYSNTGFKNMHGIYWSEQIRIGEGSAGYVVLQRKLVRISDLHNVPEFTQSSYSVEENFRSYFGIPLIGKGLIKGVLEVFTKKESHPKQDWINFLHALAGQAAIAIDNVQLFKNLQRSSQELILAYDATLAGWGRALELRDKETQGHSDRVVEFTLELARHMGIEGEELTHIMRGTLLHDIGKMGIPDYILHKPGPLTEEEWDIMRQHPQYAFDLMSRIPYLRPATDIPYGHHERWDGSGYPRGLKGEEIPVAARIFAVVDIWDALLNDRVYRDAWPEEKVLEYLKNTAGIELDPAIVEAFLELFDKEKRIKEQTE